MREALFHFSARTIESTGESNGERDRFGPRAASVLLVPSPCTRSQFHAATQQQSANALGSVKLVGAERERIDAKLVEMYRDLAGGLGRITVEVWCNPSATAGPVAERLGYGPDGLKCSYFMVNQHHGDQARLRAQAIRKRCGMHSALGIHGEQIEDEPLFGQLAQWFRNSRVLDGTSYQMSGRIAAQAEEGQIIGLGGAAGEDYFVRLRAEMRGDAFAGVFECPACPAAGGMCAGGIAEFLREIRSHRLPHHGQHRCGSVIVEIDTIHATSSQR